METMSYIDCDVPAGMGLREWRRATSPKRRRFHWLHLRRRHH
jgi:hypothetical protein